MSQMYADRIFVAVNGFEMIDVQSVQSKHNFNRKAVSTMSRNRRNRGHVQGNLEINLTIQVAVQNLVARPKFDSIDYEANDVAITCIFGAEQFTYLGCFLQDNDDNGSGVGNEVTASFNFGALDYKDPIGLAAETLDIQLAA